MLLDIFKSKQPLALLLIFVFAVLLWINPFASNVVLFDDSHNQMPFYILSKSIIVPGGVFSKIIGLILVFSMGLLIVRLNEKYSFFAERSYFSTLLFFTLLIGVANVHDYYSALPAGILFIFVIDKLLQTYKTDGLSYKIFDAAFILSIATLFYFNAIFLLIFVWISLLILRPFYWREWVFSLLGFAVPAFLTFSMYYLFNIPYPKIAFQWSHHADNHFGFSTMQLIFLGVNFVLVLVTSQFLLRSMGSKKVFTRRSYNLFLSIFLLSLFLFLSIATVSTEIMVFAAIPLTILYSHYFLQAKTTRWMNILFYIYLASFLLTQLVPVE